MLATPEQAEKYHTALNEYLELHKDTLSPYTKEMANHVSATLLDQRDFRFPTTSSTHYDDQLLTIKNLLLPPINAGSIERIHFELAKTLRYISALGSTPNFSSLPIIQFYARPKYEEIPLSSTDEIIFGIAHIIYREKIESPFKKLRETATKVEDWTSKIGQWEERSIAAEGRYREVVSGNNYLGLSHAFDRIVKSKSEEAKNLLYALKLAGGLALSLPLLQLILGIYIFLFEKKPLYRCSRPPFQLP